MTTTRLQVPVFYVWLHLATLGLAGMALWVALKHSRVAVDTRFVDGAKPSSPLEQSAEDRAVGTPQPGEVSLLAPSQRSAGELEDLRSEVRALSERIRALEARGHTAAELAPMSGAAPGTDPGEALATLFAESQKQLGIVPKNEIAELIAMREEFLNRFPDHPAAEAQLLALVADSERAGEHEEGLRRLDEYAWKVGLAEHVEAKLRGNLLLGDHRYEDARNAWLSIVSDSGVPVEDQAHAAFWAAYSSFQAGRPAEAKAEFEALIQTYGSSSNSGVQSTVAGAKLQLSGS